MTRIEKIKNKYDFYFGEGNPETDSVADEDTSYLLQRVEKLTEVLEIYAKMDENFNMSPIARKALEEE